MSAPVGVTISVGPAQVIVGTNASFNALSSSFLEKAMRSKTSVLDDLLNSLDASWRDELGETFRKNWAQGGRTKMAHDFRAHGEDRPALPLCKSDGMRGIAKEARRSRERDAAIPERPLADRACPD